MTNSVAGHAARDAEVVLDLSRLMSRILRKTPTGVDRVELAYALTLLRLIPDRVQFGARFPYGMYGRLDKKAVRQFLTYTGALWRHGEKFEPMVLNMAVARHLTALRPRIVPPRRGRRVFLQVSPHHLDREASMSRILKREDAKFVPMVHDLIPITHPEYARDRGDEQHRRRISTISRLASGIIVNSAATGDVLAPLLSNVALRRHIAVAHLGTDSDEEEMGIGGNLPPPPKPYFVCVGTIEPRKNHLLLLNIWKRMAERYGLATPELHLVGKRGWENEQIIDMLDRCRPLKGLVFEHGKMSDRQMYPLMRNARALLLPSFAEGFGMPVPEALAIGLPVIASDIEALREVGGNVPEYLDPLDGPAWQAAIIDYGDPLSARRGAQIDRMTGWTRFTWDDHIDTVMRLIDTL